ncbi:uncharacterized protein LOC126809104 isoform X2 [Patella vulgata]|uniref:uncharacterized protein LOC126809104 isoform X2 n=1 Tax=Patella vulgata TaxID=6465 RepID=UPI00217FD49D|nr:uncharacterized protein LOC126809104 isoform X2 [Patella vulgata]
MSSTNFDASAEIRPNGEGLDKELLECPKVCSCDCRKSLKTLTVLCVASCILCVVCLITVVTLIWLNFHGYRPLCEYKIASDKEAQNHQLAFRDTGDNFELSLTDRPFDRVGRAAKEDKKETKPKKKRRHRKCKCKRGKKGPKGDSADPLQAAHYSSNFENYESDKFKEYKSDGSSLRCVKSDSTTVCRNRTIIIPKPETNYKFLHPAKWLKTETNPLIFKPKYGKFEVKYSGIYLIYSTTNFYDAKTKLCHTIKVNDKARLICMDGVDAVEHDDYKYNIRHKTCSVTGVLQLSKGDTIVLQNMLPNLTIDISKDRTFFGVVLLNKHND